MHYKRLICMGVSLLITIGVQGISIAADSYDPYKTASYASKYAVNHNSNYKYFSGSDCTNFISQSAKAGGQAMDMNKWYPFITTPEIFRKNDMWYYIGGDVLYKTTTAWTTVAGFEYYVKNDGRSDWKIVKKDISAEELAKNVRIGDIVSVAKIGSNGKVLSYYHNIVCTSRFTNSNETDAVFFSSHSKDYTFKSLAAIMRDNGGNLAFRITRHK